MRSIVTSTAKVRGHGLTRHEEVRPLQMMVAWQLCTLSGLTPILLAGRPLPTFLLTLVSISVCLGFKILVGRVDHATSGETFRGRQAVWRRTIWLHVHINVSLGNSLWCSGLSID